jgi:hypothetical protein
VKAQDEILAFVLFLNQIPEGRHQFVQLVPEVVGKLLPRHPQLDHHPLVPFVIDQEVAMEEKAAVFLKVRARDGFAPRKFSIESRGPQDDVLTVERAVALTNRHRCLPRVVPHGCEAIRLAIEAGDSGARALRSVSIEEDEIGLQKLALLDHVLLACCFGHDRLAIHWEECLHHVPLAGHLREQLLAGARSVRRLVLIVGLLRDRRGGDEQNRCNPFRHARDDMRTLPALHA